MYFSIFLTYLRFLIVSFLFTAYRTVTKSAKKAPIPILSAVSRNTLITGTKSGKDFSRTEVPNISVAILPKSYFMRFYTNLQVYFFGASVFNYLTQQYES